LRIDFAAPSVPTWMRHRPISSLVSRAGEETER
jgi:hypothetical protein